MCTLTFYGHACFLLTTRQGRILIDPWLADNPHTRTSPDELECEYIVLTHGHFDHCADAERIAKRLDIPIVAASELAMHYERLGCRTIRMNAGGRKAFAFGSLEFTQAWHSSSFIQDSVPLYAGLAAGLLFTIGEKHIYHAGDTGLFGDMIHIGKVGLDCALLPIGGSVTMDIPDAVTATRLLKPRLVIPMHYNSFPAVMQDVTQFETEIGAIGQTECRILAPGQSFTL